MTFLKTWTGVKSQSSLVDGADPSTNLAVCPKGMVPKRARGPKRRADQWERGGPANAAMMRRLPAPSVDARSPYQDIAALKMFARDGSPEVDLRALAREVLTEVEAGIEAGGDMRWRSKTYRAALTNASTQIAQDTVKALTVDIEAGKPITQAMIRTAVAEAVAKVVQNVPGVLRRENLIGFGLFAVGLSLSGFMNVGLMELAAGASIGTKLAVQGVISTCMGYLLAVFNPHFNDKVSNRSRALNYKIVNGAMGLLGAKKSEHENAVAVEASIQRQLGEVFIAHEAFEGRLRGVLTLIREFSLLMSEAFFKARYILDDESNPDRMKDACDLLAGNFVTARLVFYALKPEFTDIFDAYIYSVLEPTLRKHSSVHGPEMFERIMAEIRMSKPTPSEETLDKYYAPFVRGTLGLDHDPGRNLMTEVNAILRAGGTDEIPRRSTALPRA